MSDEEAFLASGPWISSTNLLHSASQFAQWCNLLARPYTTHLLIFTCGSLRIFCWWSVDAVAVCIPFQRCSWKHGCARATRPIWVSFQKPYIQCTRCTRGVLHLMHTSKDLKWQQWTAISSCGNASVSWTTSLLYCKLPTQRLDVPKCYKQIQTTCTNLYELIVMLQARVQFFDACWDRLQMHEETTQTCHENN